LRTDVLFIRAQSTIRADGSPAAQVRTLLLQVFSGGRRCRQSAIAALARANRVFRADEKRIRTESTVMDKSRG